MKKFLVVVGFLVMASLPLPARAADSGAPTEGLISIYLDDVELVDILRMFSRIAGANFHYNHAEIVYQRATVNVEDEPWRPALQGVLAKCGFALIADPGSRESYSIVKADTPETAVRIQYASAAVPFADAALADIRSNNLASATNRIQPFADINRQMIAAFAAESSKASTNGALQFVPQSALPWTTTAAASDEARRGLVSIMLEGTELVEALGIFAQITGAKIQYNPRDFSGTPRYVFVSLTKEPWRPALEALLAERGFVLLAEPGANDTYSIVKADKPETAVRIQYASAAVSFAEAALADIRSNNIAAATTSIQKFADGNRQTVKAFEAVKETPQKAATNAVPQGIVVPAPKP